MIIESARVCYKVMDEILIHECMDTLNGDVEDVGLTDNALRRHVKISSSVGELQLSVEIKEVPPIDLGIFMDPELR